MVYRPFSKAKERTTEEKESLVMATAPVKSQPLHNFSLPHLKWGKNQTSNQRCRKLNESSRDSTSIDHHLHNQQNNRSSASEAESDGGSSSHHQDTVNQRNSVGSTRTGKNRFLASGSSSVVVKTESRCDDGKSNLVIRISKGESVVSKNKSGSGNGGSGGEAEGDGGKPWNLRPRRSIGKTNNNDHNHGAMKNGGGGELEEMIQPKSLRLRGLLVETENVEKKEKLKFSIPLARDEIEEDFFAWTGSKPPRRPKKRNRSIQKQLDNTFPGLWLAGITADCYNVPEVTSKHK